MTRSVRILYEDTGDPNEFGPHKLITRYVCDALGQEPWQLKDRLRGDPKRGNGNVLRACREDLGKLVKAEKVPSLGYLVRKVAEILGSPPR